jgi:Amt family ammonium transporter
MAGAGSLLAQTPAEPAPVPEPGLAAYLNNTDPAGTVAAGVAGPGHNAWMMTSAALVLFMTLPGLALFYGGLVRKKNVLSVVAQCFGCAGLVTILWVVCGYTMVFGEHPADNCPSWAPFLGNFKHIMMNGVTSAPDTSYCYWVSENVFAIYQMMFAIITPALIVGAIAERMKFAAVMAFITLWMFAVYFPLAHMVWGFDGFMNGVWNGAASIKAIDFAGGTVVHMSSGWSALLLCLLLGKRTGYGKAHMAPHSMVLCAIGTGMLWVGWYGFNAGSAVAADGVATNAFTTTTLAAAVATFVWGAIEKIFRGHASILGMCSGAVAGLVVITPAAGFVDSTGAVIIGVLAAVVPYFFVTTTVATAVACFVWPVAEWITKGKPSILGFCSGAVAGLVVVTPACGFITITGALIIGVLAGIIPFIFCTVVKKMFGYDDALDTFGVHAVGGTLGALLTGFLATKDVNGNLVGAYAQQNGLDKILENGTLWLEQVKAIGVTLALSLVATLIITLIVKVLIGLRPSVEDEDTGLDLVEHGEAGYEM